MNELPLSECLKKLDHDTQQGRVFEQPTVIIVHGGHGISPANVDMAVWLRKELKANVLILDSYWSRGRSENWLVYAEHQVAPIRRSVTPALPPTISFARASIT